LTEAKLNVCMYDKQVISKWGLDWIE